MKNIDKLVGREIYGTETSGVLRRNYLKTGSGQLQSVDESGKGTSVKQFFRVTTLHHMMNNKSQHVLKFVYKKLEI